MRSNTALLTDAFRSLRRACGAAKRERWVAGEHMVRLLAAASLSCAVAGCYNPLNAATADRYAQTCRDAQASGRLEVAEEACRRSLINVRIGHLGPEAESQELYNLGRVKRQLRKFAEAEEFYQESLKIQETLSPRDELKIGRRLAELVIVMGEQAKFKDAWPILTRLVPISERYSGQERVTVKKIFEVYAAEYKKLGMESEASQLEERVKTL
jgi:tetratricopeptide (TPR) repeat protein